MFIIVNPYSAGGTALKKWEKFINKIPPGALVCFLNDNIDLNEKIRESVSKGNYEFIAAGGDGSINLLLNNLMAIVDKQEIYKIKLGAIGLGSSNDFHKPFNKSRDIPSKINFKNAAKRDVAFISYKKNNEEIIKYFLVNASVGITADANYFFNNPDYILKFLKKLNTNLAIAYSAFKTIFRSKNLHIKINDAENGEIFCPLTNIGIIKNPNFSGNLSYGGIANYDNGKLDIHLCCDMNMPDKLQLLRALSNGRFSQITKAKSWTTSEIAISASVPFNVEFDGEVITAESVKFGILQKYIMVCHD